MEMNNDMIITIITATSGIAAAVFAFLGLRNSASKLDKEDRTVAIPKKVIIRSTVYMIFSILLLAVMRTCGELGKAEAKDLDIIIVYLHTLVETVKYFGFIILLPVVLNYVRTTKNKNRNSSEE
ncbi:MAG: hypothetical protein J5786_01915 [Clostridiales bacterium]|nr:hypothetical protein [Clostridiales bacterium]